MHRALGELYHRRLTHSSVRGRRIPSLPLPCWSCCLLSAQPRCSATHPPLLSVFLLVPPQYQLFLSVHPGSLMLEDLPYERFRRAENCSLLPCASLSPPSTPAWLTSSLCKQPPHPTPPLSPKGTPGVPQSDSHYAEPWSQISLHLHRQSRAEQSTARHSTAQHSTARRQMLHLLFHSEYTQGAESRHAASVGHASAVRDWLVVVVTTGRQAR